MKLKTNRYYHLQDGQILKLTYDTGKISAYGYGGEAYAETLAGQKVEPKLSRDLFLNAQILHKFRPTIPEIWEIVKNPAEPLEVWQRLKAFFTKLIEFDHIKIQTLGYFNKSKKVNKETVGESIAFKLAEHFMMGFDVDNDHCRAIRENLVAWATNPTDANRQKVFGPPHRPLQIYIDRNCCITGERFRWRCNGKIVWPYQRWTTQQEQEELTTKLKAELQTLRNLPKLTPAKKKRKELLTEVLETPNGWMRGSDLINQIKVLPFQQVYCDPQTGLLPKAIVEINVPTGQLVFANSLFAYLQDLPEDIRHDQAYSLCHTMGRHRHIQFHATTNQAFFVPLSNNSPHIWQNRENPNRLRVGQASDEPEKGEWAYQDALKEWEDKGTICTDLWAFHAVDRSFLPDQIAVDYFIVRIQPGRYRLINHFEHEGWKTGVFCEIERIDQ